MSTARIYVGNLPFAATEEELAALFAASGAVKTATVARFGARPRGFGFVEFEDAASVAGAVEAFNGTEFKGRELRVEAEKPKSDEQRTADREKRRALAAARREAAIAAAASDESKAELSMRVYVGNLPYSVDTEALTGLFSSCAGFVSAEVAADRNGEGSRGFGYVTFSTEADLNAAIAAFNNTEHGGRVLVVERELPKTTKKRTRRPRNNGAGAGGAGAGGAGAGGDAAPVEVIENNPCRVYVGNVPFSFDEAALREAFASCGAITEVTVPDLRPGHRLGFAYVTFATPEAAATAVETLNETDMGGRTVRVELENRKPKKKGRARSNRNRVRNRRRRGEGAEPADQ